MLSGLLLSGILLAASGKAAPAAVNPKLSFTSISNAAAAPSAITFPASNPTGSPVVAGSSSVVVSWTTTGTFLGSWNLAVSAPASFSSCPWIPVSAVTVSCGSVTGGSGGTCGGSAALTTGAAQIASGTEGLLVATNYSVSLNFTLQDSWKYIASTSCSLSVSYTITAN